AEATLQAREAHRDGATAPNRASKPGLDRHRVAAKAGGFARKRTVPEVAIPSEQRTRVRLPRYEPPAIYRQNCSPILPLRFSIGAPASRPPRRTRVLPRPPSP